MTWSVALTCASILAIGVALAFVSYGALRVSRRVSMGLLVVLSAPILTSPFLLPTDFRFTRFVMATLCAANLFKLIDLHQAATTVPDLRRFALFLANPTSLVFRRLDAEPSPTVLDNLRRLGLSLVQAAIGFVLMHLVFAAHLGRWSFALEHTAKLATFYLAALGGIATYVTLWRLGIGKARDPFHNIYTARTPAEFWRRYNRTVGQFFHENLFKLAGGLRAPVRATLVVFAASSLLHEYVFAFALGEVQGLQTAFFMTQGAAVAATLRVRPRGRAAVAWTVATLAFNIASGVLFVASLHQILPFWDRAPFGLPEPP